MAYLIFTTSRGRELGRRPLERSMVIGRATDCDICIHDILLSRRHCQVEQTSKGWIVTDLESKNGTYLGASEVGRHLFSDGDTLRIGKTTVIFCAGKMKIRGGRAMEKPNKGRARPADPFAALADTVCGFDYAKSLIQRRERLGARPRQLTAAGSMGKNFPTPQPMPRDPTSYASDDVYNLINEIASSSWDSIYMHASRPAATRPPPRPIVFSSRHPRHRNAAPVAIDFTVNTTPGLLVQVPRTLPPPPMRRRMQRFLGQAVRVLSVVGQSALAMGMAYLMCR